MDFERRFLAAFDEVDVFEVSESRLTLRFDGGELVFEAGGRLLPPEEATTAPSDGSDARADGADGTSAAL